MNDKNKSGKKNYILAGCILLLCLVGVIAILKISQNVYKAKPLKEVSITTNTEKIPDEDNEIPTTTTSIKNDISEEPPIEVINFSASLEEVADGIISIGNYKESRRYSGAKFDFNCTNYDLNTNKCLEGSALMNLGDVMLPLYTYKNEEGNYLNHPTNYYIIVDDNYIVLINNKVGSISGEAKFYSRNGKYLSTINNVITGYLMNGKIQERLYPNITDNLFYYYTCNEKVAKVASIEVPKFSNNKIEQIIESSSCN